MSRDELWTHPELTAMANQEAGRLMKSLRLDVVDAKEVYRTIMDVAVRFTLARGDGEYVNKEGQP
jgi:hypothetical protein